MKRMSQVVLALAFCVSTQAFGWVIRFDKNTYGGEFEVLTFEEFGDYRRMLRQEMVGKEIEDNLLIVAPLVGKVAGEVNIAGSTKAPAKESSAAGAAKEPAKESSVAEAAGKKAAEALVTVSAPEFVIAQEAVKASSKLLTEFLKANLFTKPFGYLTREGYTVDYISSFKPSRDGNYKCKDAKQLKDHAIHPIKSNKKLFFVVYDKKSKKVLFADHASAYGFFTFKLVDLVDQETGAQLKVGDLKEINAEGGKSCPGVYGEIPLPK